MRLSALIGITIFVGLLTVGIQSKTSDEAASLVANIEVLEEQQAIRLERIDNLRMEVEALERAIRQQQAKLDRLQHPEPNDPITTDAQQIILYDDAASSRSLNRLNRKQRPER